MAMAWLWGAVGLAAALAAVAGRGPRRAGWHPVAGGAVVASGLAAADAAPWAPGAVVVVGAAAGVAVLVRRRRPVADAATIVPFGAPRAPTGASMHRDPGPRTLAALAPWVWSAAATAALVAVAVGAGAAAAGVFAAGAVAGMVAAARRPDRAPGVPIVLLVLAPVVALGLVVTVHRPDTPPPVTTTTTTVATTATGATTTIVPPAALFLEVDVRVGRRDGSFVTALVDGAYVSLSGEGTFRYALTDPFGRATFFVDPGVYTVTVEPPDRDAGWMLGAGCRARLDDVAIGAGEQWVWTVRFTSAGDAPGTVVPEPCEGDDLTLR